MPRPIGFRTEPRFNEICVELRASSESRAYVRYGGSRNGRVIDIYVPKRTLPDHGYPSRIVVAMAKSPSVE